jgi:lycopene epsilon-cyclase
VRVKAGSAGSESCVAVDFKDGFSDKEDFVKAGGSELLFVQMQQNKLMDKQSKLADKV